MVWQTKQKHRAMEMISHADNRLEKSKFASRERERKREI